MNATDKINSLYKEANSKLSDINKLKSEYDSMYTEYNKLIKSAVQESIKEKVDDLKKSLNGIATVTLNRGQILVELKDKTKYRAYYEIVGSGAEGLKPVDVKKNMHNEISSMRLEFTNQYLKSKFKFKTLRHPMW